MIGSCPRHRALIRGLALWALAVGPGMIAGCEGESGTSPRSAEQSGGGETSNPPARHWHVAGEDAFLVAVDDAAIAGELAAAAQEARASAEQARLQWRDAVLTEQRIRWMVQWSAPVVDERSEGDQVEHVWVRPVEWSPFRIEGILLSEPRGDIGAGAGELVSFPIEQLSDWVHLVEREGIETREGGFTLGVLEEHFGVPEGGEPR